MLCKKILFSFCFVLLLSCNERSDLKSDKAFVKTFNQEELDDIIFLIDYVDILVKEETGVEDINSAYRLYFNNLRARMFEGHFMVPIKSEAKFSFLENIEESTFNEFWYVDMAHIDTTRDTGTNSKKLRVNIYGKYLDYIRKVGESDDYFCDLHEFIMGSGDISRSGLIIYFANNKSVDYQLIKNRLLAVVCIFSINEPLKPLNIPRNRWDEASKEESDQGDDG